MGQQIALHEAAIDHLIPERGKVAGTDMDKNGEPRPGSRYVGVRKNVLKGSPEPADITTWLVERENGFLRQANRRFTRKTNAFSKVMEFHERQVAIWIHYRNYCWIPNPSRPKDGSK